jgi:hypothetical protein
VPHYEISDGNSSVSILELALLKLIVTFACAVRKDTKEPCPSCLYLIPTNVFEQAQNHNSKHKKKKAKGHLKCSFEYKAKKLLYKPTCRDTDAFQIAIFLRKTNLKKAAFYSSPLFNGSVTHRSAAFRYFLKKRVPSV